MLPSRDLAGATTGVASGIFIPDSRRVDHLQERQEKQRGIAMVTYTQ
jgi:hypothetical protein